VVVALYFSVAKIGIGGLVSLALVSLFLYRRIRNRSETVQVMFVRSVSKIPEVRLIVIQDHRVSVVVDRPAVQLFERINAHLRTCNQKHYFGPAMILSILHELSTEQTRNMLASSGVQFVREDVVEPAKNTMMATAENAGSITG